MDQFVLAIQNKDAVNPVPVNSDFIPASKPALVEHLNSLVFGKSCFTIGDYGGKT